MYRFGDRQMFCRVVALDETPHKDQKVTWFQRSAENCAGKLVCFVITL